jgi:hypothetical protein
MATRSPQLILGLPDASEKRTEIRRLLRGFSAPWRSIHGGFPMLRFGSILMLAFAGHMFAQNVTWVSMQETQEHSFSLEVPKGWQAAGGIVHVPGLFEFRMWVDVTSPDGKTKIRLGDPNISMSYSIPDSISAYYHVAEGRRMINHMMVMRYEPGQTLAELYGHSRFADSCSNVQTSETKPLPAIHQVSTPGFHADAGQAILQCTQSGQEMGGYVFAETFYEPQLTPRQVAPMANWLVTGLGSFLSPKGQGSEMFKIFYHMFSTFRLNPAWLNAFANQFNGAARAAFQSGMNQIQASMQRFEQQSAESAKRADDYSRVVMGQTLQKDPNTGQAREVAQGSWNSYWSNSKGQVVSSALSPGPGFSPMTPVK